MKLQRVMERMIDRSKFPNKISLHEINNDKYNTYQGLRLNSLELNKIINTFPKMT